MSEPKTDILYPFICSWGNLLSAYAKAAAGKRGRKPAADFEYKLEDNLVRLQEELFAKAYRPGPYVSFYIHEPKRRLISAAPFRDRVVHHALCNLVEPIFERSFIFDSYANRVKKGTHRAIDRAQHFARRSRYVLSCDIRQFFPSIDHALLRNALAQKIEDPDVLWLIDRILESGEGVLKSAYDMVWFPGDDLFAINRPRGLPIGNLTSQFWANCFLNVFDHFVKRELRCRHYVRYVDDMLLFADEKATLWRWKRALIQRLAGLRLTIHETRAQVLPARDGFPFLGFQVFPRKRRLKRRKGVAFQRRLKGQFSEAANGERSLRSIVESARGWRNHVRYADTEALVRDVLGGVMMENPEKALHGRDTAIHQNF